MAQPRARKSVKLETAMFLKVPKKGQNEHWRLWATVAPDSLDLLRVDFSYHRYKEKTVVREAKRILANRPAITRDDIAQFSPLQLAVRGNRYTKRNGVIFVHDPLFIIDGRVRVALAKMMSPPAALRAEIFFNMNPYLESAFFDLVPSEIPPRLPNTALQAAVEEECRLGGGDPDIVADIILRTEGLKPD